MPMDRGTPDLVRHCVAAVADRYGGDTSKAFAICVAQLQKAGYLKPGTMELTAAGKKKEKEHEQEPDMQKRMKAYEKLLKANRKEEALDPHLEHLVRPTRRSGFEDLPRMIVRRFESVSRDETSMDTMRRLSGITERDIGHTLQEQTEDAMAMLAAALKKQKLPTTSGERMASAKEFALMAPAPVRGMWQFKHHDSRNYVFIDAKTGKMIVPKENKPFMQGVFDSFDEPKATENWKPVIDQINKLTDGNNHTEAVRALAMFALPDPTNKYRKMIDAAIALENAYGELPPGVDIIRKEVAIKALQALKGSPAYKPIRDAIGY